MPRDRDGQTPARTLLTPSATDALRIPALTRRRRRIPSEINHVTDQEFLNRIPRLSGSDDPKCNLSIIGLFLAGQQWRRGDGDNTVQDIADCRRAVGDRRKLSRVNDAAC